MTKKKDPAADAFAALTVACSLAARERWKDSEQHFSKALQLAGTRTGTEKGLQNGILCLASLVGRRVRSSKRRSRR